MNSNDICGYKGLREEAQVLIEHEQTPFLSMHYDKISEKVFILADSETLQKVREVKALVEIEDILKITFEESKKLTMYDQKFEVSQGRPPYPSCEHKRAGGLSHHTCHAIKPQYQLSWENNLQGCFEDRTRTDANYERLPKEILRGIFDNMEPSDLKSVTLVCKYWKSVADEPALWKGFDLPFKCKKSETKFFKFFQKSISSKLQILSLHNFAFQLNDDHIQKLLNLELKKLTIRNIDLFNISDDFLAQVVNNSKECEILEPEAKLNTADGININVLGLNKLKAIFRKMESGTNLKSLTLSCLAGSDKSVDLSFVPSSTLANAFNKLESLELSQVKLRQSQLKTIFDYMNVKTKLKSLDLHSLSLDLDSVDMEIFDSAFSNLSELILNGMGLDNNQLNHFAENLDKSCKLKTLMISNTNMKDLSPGLLARVVTKISFVDLESVEMTVDQLEQIFQTISTVSSAIKQLNLSDIADIHEIHPESLAIGINKLECFDFVNVGTAVFTEDQTKAIFKVMSQRTCLKMLGTISNVMPLELMDNIKIVDPEILANAVHNLVELKLDMEYSLTLPQYFAIFKKFGDSKSKIKKVSSQEEDIYM